MFPFQQKKRLPVGTRNQENREVWLKRTLKKIPKGKKILDAGAGELQYKKFCTHLNYVSQDFAQYDGSGDSKGLQTDTWDNSKLDIVSDITDIPVKDMSFDAVMCVEVFEHLPDPVAAFKELHRVLKKGGYLIITAPFASLTHFSPYHFSTGFNRYFYQYHSDRLGFEILDLKTNGTYFDVMAQELRRLKFVVDKYSRLGEKDMMKIGRKIEPVVQELQHFQDNNKKSEELLCYGYHYFGKKK